jgi:hypothetical protein
VRKASTFAELEVQSGVCKPLGLKPCNFRKAATAALKTPLFHDAAGISEIHRRCEANDSADMSEISRRG